MLSVNTNISALNAHRNLSNTQNNLGKSLEKLSSGFRINRAADDAAGLAISEGLRSQIGGLTQAARNAQDGISVVQTAEGALTEVHAILQRMRDLAVQAANDSNNADARNNISTEVSQLVEELARIAESTNFNGTALLKGGGTLNFQVGADGDGFSRIAVDLTSADVSAVANALQTGMYSQTGSVNAAAATGDWTFTQDSVVVTVAMGAAGTHTSVGSIVDHLNNDAGFRANFKASIDPAGDLKITSLNSNSAITVAGAGYTAGAGAAGALDFSTHADAQAAITAISLQIEKISTARADLGALQNRFEHTIKNINVAVENLTASESRIRDTDMAAEMVKYSSASILQQAGTSMLAQANQSTQAILKLLG